MNKKIFGVMGVIIVLTVSLTHFALAAAPFYEGKTIRIIVGYSAGGGFDLNARMIARHMGKYVPGHPTLIVENMTGAGGLILANHLYKVAKPDGLVIGHFIGYLIFNQILDQPGVEFDGKKFGYLGAAMQEKGVLALTKASGITSIDKLVASKTPVKLGGVALANSVDNHIRIMRSALGLPIQLISGYKGTADIRLAAESGEVAGTAFGWDSMKSTWRQSLETGVVIPVLQATAQPLPDLPNVPLAINYAKTKEGRQLLEVGLHSSSAFSRVFALPPGVPNDRIQTLRRAFEETMKDNDYLGEMEKSNMGPDPVTGQELENIISNVYKLEPGFLARLKDVLFK